MRAVVIRAYGGRENLALEELDPPVPRAGHVLVQVEAAGLNFHDIIERRGGYPGLPHPPVRAGVEGAGTVVAVGAGTTGPAVGDRVMWAHVPGSHAELAEVPAASAVPVPGWLPTVEAAAVCSQGITAHYLANSLRSITAGETALVWSAAGGVGRLLTQLLAAKGVRVIAATSSEAKAKEARTAGAAHAVGYRDVKVTVEEVTGGTGVDVVFDGVGAPTFDTSVASVRRRGLLVVYGGAGGQVPPVDLVRLASAGSVQLVRPRLADFIASRAELLQRGEELVAAIRNGEVTVRIGATYALTDIADAHRALESRATVGKVVLIP